MSFIDDLIHWFSSLFSQTVFMVELIEKTKQEVKDDFQSIIDEARILTKESADFADRVRTLRTKVIRADLVFELIDEIRTGELREFAVEGIQDISNSIAATLEEVIKTGRAIGALKNTTQLTKILIRILGVWTQIAKVVHTLRNILPVIKSLQQKIERFERIIMPQDKPRVYVTEKYYKRGG